MSKKAIGNIIFWAVLCVIVFFVPTCPVTLSQPQGDGSVKSTTHHETVAAYCINRINGKSASEDFK